MRQRYIMIARWLLVIALFAPAPGIAADPAALLATHYFSKTPAQVVTGGMTLQQAEAVQNAFVARLSARLGPVAGYKAGLTNPQIQKRFGIDHPLPGFLLHGMLVESGATLPARFGARPMAEADLVARVSGECINTAGDQAAALACLDAVYPFIELPDLMYPEGVALDGAAVLAVNVGARLGVLGKPVEMQAVADWQQRLGTFRVELLDAQGRPIALGNGSALLGHPLQAVLWLRDALKARGVLLKRGDLLSLGALTPLAPVRPGATLRARYVGLDPRGPVEAVVQFR